MKKITLYLLTALVTILCPSLLTQSHAQSFRQIKVAQTLRAAKQYAEAEKYLQKGLKMAKDNSDKYWEAVAYENLAYLALDQSNLQLGTHYFSKAKDKFIASKATLSAKIISQFLDGLNGHEDIYAGIDVGASGVKLSMIGAKLSNTGRTTFRIISEKSFDPNALDCTENVFNDAARYISSLLDTVYLRKIPKDKVFIVISSGLKTGLSSCGGLEKFRNILNAEIKDKYTGIIDVIDACDEGMYGIKGTILSENWTSTAMIDIGSGNTKGGYLNNDGSLSCININKGTKSLTKVVVEKKQGMSVLETANSVYTSDLKQSIKEQITSQNTGFKNREQVYLIGGIVWAMITYMHPDKILDKEVVFTYHDVEEFVKLASEDYSKLTTPDLSNIENDKAMQKITEEISKCKGVVFKQQEQVICGGVLLKGIMDEIRSTSKNHKFVFHREGIIGWISGYTLKRIASDYTKTTD